MFVHHFHSPDEIIGIQSDENLSAMRPMSSVLPLNWNLSLSAQRGTPVKFFPVVLTRSDVISALIGFPQFGQHATLWQKGKMAPGEFIY